MTFGEKLYALRKEKGLAAKDVAKQVGTSESTLLRIEKGKAHPKSPEMVEAFAKLYGCTVKELTDDSVDLLNKEAAEKTPEKAPEKDPKKKVVQIVSHGRTMAAVPKDPEKKVSDIDKLEELRKELIEKDTQSTEQVPAEEKNIPAEKNDSEKRIVELKSFGKKLRDLRIEKDMSLTRISDAVGIRKGAYQGMEYRNSRPRDVKVYDKLAEVLGCEVAYLTDGDERFSPQKHADEKPISPVPASIPFGERLGALRKEKGFTLAQTAEKVGISLDAYKGMEYRNYRPKDTKVYNKLAKALGCDVGYLKEGDQKINKKSVVKKKPDKKVIEPKEKAEIPTEAIEMKKPEIPADVSAVEKNEISTEAVKAPQQADQGEIEENIPIDSIEEPVVPVEKTSASSEVIKLVSRLSVLLAGDEISKSQKDAVMVALNGAYWR